MDNLKITSDKETNSHRHITHIDHNNKDIVIYLEKQLIETATIKQIKAMALHSSLNDIRVMPDCHVGHGCCVGFTARTQYNSVIPSYVGGDIGCGILTYPLTNIKVKLIKLEKLIKNIIPLGNGYEHIHDVRPIEDSYILKYLNKAQITAQQFVANNNIPSDKVPNYTIDYLAGLCDRIGIDYDFCIRSFGTLGGGNHFIEINSNSKTGENYLTIHSGSRAFGMKLFEYYNKKVNSESKCLAEGDAIDYCFDMVLAQQLAIMNRRIMLDLIIRSITDEPVNQDSIIESIHNYIDFNGMILRKGAISAREGELCVVSLNMRDGVLLCRGKGNPDWNYSCAHGAGRIMSRSEARKRIKLREFTTAMQDVVTTSVCSGTLDEAPQAYKESHIITAALEPTVEIVEHLLSVMNIKAIDY